MTPAVLDQVERALAECTEITHKAYVSATMEAVNVGPSHPLTKNYDQWRVRCLRAEAEAREALSALRAARKEG